MSEFLTSIVIPAFNEEQRLPKTLLTLKELIDGGRLAPIEVKEVIVVDDGSRDGTVNLVRKFSETFPLIRVVESGRNYGKGHALHLGFNDSKFDWILLADADMATPWPEMVKLATEIKNKGGDVAIGSRDIVGSEVVIKQSWLRENLGKSFNVFVRVLTRLPYKDTQCGFKFFSRVKSEEWLHELHIDDFAWDVEFLLACRKHKLEVHEVPVVWRHVGGSRISPFKDGIRMLLTVTRLILFS